MGEVVQMMTELIKKAQKQGEIDVNVAPHDIAMYLFSSLQGLRLTGMLNAKKTDLEAIKSNILTAI